MIDLKIIRENYKSKESTAAIHPGNTYATINALIDEYELLRKAINESTDECDVPESECNSFGCRGDCPNHDPARWLADQQKEIETLRARLKENNGTA